MNIARLALAPLLLTIVACSSSDPAQDPGLTNDPSTPPGEGAKNPYGAPYPTENIGTQQRVGSRRGNTIENYSFRGYRDADMSNGLQRISLADFYDPEGRTYKLIHLVAAGVWCTPCRNEADMVTPLKAQFDQKGIVWLVSLVNGPAQGSPSTEEDLRGWITDFDAPYTHWLDPNNENLGPFFDAAAIPWNANIDPKTMEILSAGTGAPPNVDALWADLDEWLGKLNGGAAQ